MYKLVGNKAKGRILKRVFQKNEARQMFRKTNISYPLINTRTGVYQGVRNVRFTENLPRFVFLKHPFWDSPFCLLTGKLRNYKNYILKVSEYWSEVLTSKNLSSAFCVSPGYI